MNAWSNTQVAVRELVREELNQRQSRNKSYSLRALAKSIPVAPGALSEILNSKRPVTLAFARVILKGLKVPKEKSGEILKSLSENRSQRKARLRKVVQLEMADYQTISQWHHFAILALAETKDFRADAHWISERLGITPRDASFALKSLLHIGMLVKRGSRIVPTDMEFETSADVPNPYLASSHLHNIELAEKSLQRDSVFEREFISLTVATNPRKIKEAKKRLRQFCDEMMNFLEGGEKSEVYKLNLQYFPLTKQRELKNEI